MSSKKHGTIQIGMSDLEANFDISAPAMEAEYAYGIMRPSRCYGLVNQTPTWPPFLRAISLRPFYRKKSTDAPVLQARASTDSFQLVHKIIVVSM